MANAVKWGIISTADINRKVIPGAHASPKVDLIGVASRDQARAEEYAKTWEIERAYGSYEALLADTEIEAVYISLPNTLHCEWSIRALEAGKHVLCEKPMSRHVGDVEAAFDAAETAPAHGLTPAILLMARHSSAETGDTDKRPCRTNVMSARLFSALIAARVTGVFTGISAFTSTMTKRPSLSLGSGWASLTISAMPTIAGPSPE